MVAVNLSCGWILIGIRIVIRMPIKVAIVEDSQEVREGIAFLLNASSGFECVGTFSTGEAALSDLVGVDPDVVLMDIGLPGISGIECIRKLKQDSPDLEFLMLSVFEDAERIFDSIKAGASGYLIKSTPPAKIMEGIEEIHNGGSPMSNQIARRVLDSLRPEPTECLSLAKLSKKERVVLEKLAEGLLYKEIANKLSVSVHTVRSQVHSIYKKLHVGNRIEAIEKIRRP